MREDDGGVRGSLVFQLAESLRGRFGAEARLLGHCPFRG